MKERERLIVTGLVLLLVLIWLGFPFHQSPRFAGSLVGSTFGIAGALLMLVPLLYMIVKRTKPLRGKVIRLVSMRTLLAWHIYAGVLGPILVVIHSGHKYESALGIALTALTLMVVLSGFVGRYLMSQFSQEIREKKATLKTLEEAYNQAAQNVAAAPEHAKALRHFSGFFSRPIGGFFPSDANLSTSGASGTIWNPAVLLRLSESIADIEYSIKTHEKFKIWFGKWLKFHIVISIVLYVLMALHVWSAIHFGLRWL